MSAKVSELTITEFRELVAETIQETLTELLGQADPDRGLELNPEIVELIQGQRVEFAAGNQRGYSLAEILDDLRPEA